MQVDKSKADTVCLCLVSILARGGEEIADSQINLFYRRRRGEGESLGSCALRVHFGHITSSASLRRIGLLFPEAASPSPRRHSQRLFGVSGARASLLRFCSSP